MNPVKREALSIGNATAEREREREREREHARGDPVEPESNHGAGRKIQANATPGGSLMPACDYSKRQRGDAKGRPVG